MHNGESAAMIIYQFEQGVHIYSGEHLYIMGIGWPAWRWC